jgi:glutaredoxin
MQKRVAMVMVLGALGLSQCKRRPPDVQREPPDRAARAALGDAAARIPFEVRSDANDLVFFWFDERARAHAVSRASEVPEARREMVRVDPARPELRAPGWVYVADLRAPTPEGSYPVRSMRVEALSQQIMALGGQQGPLGSPPPSPQPAAAPPVAAPQAGAHAQPATANVILYGASWCGACHQTANWLRAHGIAFVEKDIEQDPGAQQEMMAKAQRAGVPTGSIPILDVRGRIMVGFSPADIERALAGS